MAIVPYENGDKYVGETKTTDDGHTVRHGRGELHGSDGTRRVGQWHNDHLDGFGMETSTGAFLLCAFSINTM